jgi:hypothetical protein
MIELKTLIFPSSVTVLTLILYLVITINIGRARGKYKVPVPQTSGDPDFERVFRVQQNTLEQLILFLPSLWLFSVFVSPLKGWWNWSILDNRAHLIRLGLLSSCRKAVTIGFGINSLSILVLLVGSLVGIIRIFATLI